jgi:hypothetical protein
LKSAENLLSSLAADEKSIRLDCTAQWLREQLPRWSICGVHLAAGAEVTELEFMDDAVVPDAPIPLGADDVGHFSPFLADSETPAGLCLGFGRATGSEETVASILDEAEQPDFQPHYGSIHALSPFKGRLLGVLTAQPGTRTTTVIDPRLKQYSESRRGVWVGMHYDNALTDFGEGERFPSRSRVAEAERRIILNTGPGPRRLVIALNMTALHLSEQVRPGDPDHIPDSKQLQTFLRDRPDVVDQICCLVMTLEPTEYVVFPAGIALHDGSMHGFDQKSVAIVLGGKFPRWSELGESDRSAECAAGQIAQSSLAGLNADACASIS